jgi:hypothetical protein
LSEPANLRIGLEGGATAIAFIRCMGWTRFEVIPEGHTGVGSLCPPDGSVLCVKPGSYLWPAGIWPSTQEILTPITKSPSICMPSILRS